MHDYQQRCFFIDNGRANRVPALFVHLVVNAGVSACFDGRFQEA
jgi:hypothetical protein